MSDDTLAHGKDLLVVISDDYIHVNEGLRLYDKLPPELSCRCQSTAHRNKACVSDGTTDCFFKRHILPHFQSSRLHSFSSALKTCVLAALTNAKPLANPTYRRLSRER
ncbi:hypothetical protein PILCRDRAFT_829126 [Piloderma croceum F 1598]|uniref:Uncharacterized protein n=1 Tax=Piloderma croceum (strain F 1598) TaxID=765440 RepID=A0A0C3F0E9_PILCF|nr:hypothetical protein PILCRDRAFT_829126 [Piloderma croceum F 1598]